MKLFSTIRSLNLLQLWHAESLYSGGDGLIGEDDDGRAVFARDIHRFTGRVEAVLYTRRSDDHPWGVPMAAKTSDV